MVSKVARAPEEVGARFSNIPTILPVLQASIGYDIHLPSGGGGCHSSGV